MSIFEHHRFEIWNQVQHPFKHSLTDFAYTNNALPGVSNVQTAMDWITAVLYPIPKAAVATPAALPAVGNTLGDYRVVTDDGDGKSAGYRWEQREGDATAKWYKIYDMDFGAGSVLQQAMDNAQELFVQKFGNDDLDSSGVAVAGTYSGQTIYGGKSASTSLTLKANAGDGVGAQTGFVQVDDMFRAATDNAWDIGTTSKRFRDIYSSRQFLGVAGTVSLPTFSFASANTYGIYQAAGTTIDFAIAGTQTLSLSAISLLLSRSTASTTISLQATNSDNTSATSHAVLGATSGGTSGGAAFSRYSNGTTNWISGQDAGSGPKFKIFQGSTFGASGTEFLSITTGGLVTLGATNNALTHVWNGKRIEIDGMTTAGNSLSLYLKQQNDSQNVIIIESPTAATADAQISFSFADGSNGWAFGRDTSDTNALVISASATLGTSNLFKIATDGTITAGSGVVTHLFTGGQFGVVGSNSGGNVYLVAQNTSNTASSFAGIRAIVAGATADDPYSLYTISGVLHWSAGVDNSDSDKYKISQASTLGTNDFFSVTTGGIVGIEAGDLKINTAGKGLFVKEGSNAKSGTATLNGTTAVVVSNTSVTASSRIQLTTNASGGTVGSPYVDTRVAGTSFSIKSTNAADTSTVAWFIVEPA